MNNQSTLLKRTTAAVATCTLLTLLSACGGGGGAAPGAATPVVTGNLADPPVAAGPVIPTFVASNIFNTAVTPTYSDAQDLAAFNLLNAQREACGFGTLTQNTALDTAARNHADWQLVNNYASHYEESIDSTTSTPTIGFTGVYPDDRAVFAGYASTIAEISIGDNFTDALGVSNKAAGVGSGISSMRSLLSAPYHQRSLLDSSKIDVGVASRSSVEAGSTYGARIIVQLDLGSKKSATQRYPSTTDVLTYPCQGVTGTAFRLLAEDPSVLANRNYATSPAGQPVFIKVREGQVLTIASATMTVTNGGAAVPLQATLTSTTDRNARVKANEAMVIPDVALLPNTNYTVNINGSNSGQAFTKSFTFSTGM